MIQRTKKPTRKITFHLVYSMPPGCYNRDDNGSPKTLTYFAAERIRISSQALKYCWRNSEEWANTMSTRTRYLEAMIRECVAEETTNPEEAEVLVQSIAYMLRVNLASKEETND